MLEVANRSTPTGLGMWSSGLLKAIPASDFLGEISLIMIRCYAHQIPRWRSETCGQILIRPILETKVIDSSRNQQNLLLG